MAGGGRERDQLPASPRVVKECSCGAGAGRCSRPHTPCIGSSGAGADRDCAASCALRLPLRRPLRAPAACPFRRRLPPALQKRRHFLSRAVPPGMTASRRKSEPGHGLADARPRARPLSTGRKSCSGSRRSARSRPRRRRCRSVAPSVPGPTRSEGKSGEAETQSHTKTVNCRLAGFARFSSPATRRQGGRQGGRSGREAGRRQVDGPRPRKHSARRARR